MPRGIRGQNKTDDRSKKKRKNKLTGQNTRNGDNKKEPVLVPNYYACVRKGRVKTYQDLPRYLADAADRIFKNKTCRSTEGCE